MLSIETLDTFDTVYSADSVEWNNDGFFVTGTYQLEERDDEASSKSTRKGRIYLFEIDENLRLKKIQQIETEAILDQKWYMEKFLLTATSLGKVQVYNFHENSLEFKYDIKLCNEEGGDNDKENLALSIDTDEKMKRIATSDSQGQISIIDIETKEILSQWAAHEFEAWTCAFDRFNSNIIYSGKSLSPLSMSKFI